MSQVDLNSLIVKKRKKAAASKVQRRRNSKNGGKDDMSSKESAGVGVTEASPLDNSNPHLPGSPIPASGQSFHI